MKLFWLLVSLVYCFALNSAIAKTNLSIIRKDIPQPVYRNMFQAWLNVGQERYRSITFEIWKDRQPLVQEKWVKRFKQQDYSACTSSLCSVFIIELPLVLERVTCSIRATLEDYSGVKSIQDIKWGECQSSASRPDDRLLGDLSLDESLSSPLEFNLRNIGTSIINKKINISSYVEDIAGNIIWADSYPLDVNMSTGDEMTVVTSALFKTWQYRLGCKAHVYIDDQYQIHERSKKNNYSEIEFGDCESLPNQASGDVFDFEPLVEQDENEIKFFVVNKGRLPIQYSHETLEYEVFYKDNTGHLIYKDTHKINAPLYGFGDSRKVFSGGMPAGACQIEVLVNKNLLLKESNYQNNHLHISHCKASGDIK